MQLDTLDQITPQYRQIYFQPHFDDAALSAGGSVALQVATGQRVLVVTVFGGAPDASAALSPFARDTQQRMGLPMDAVAAVNTRREEDAAAMRVLGADTLWLPYRDAIYRGTPAHYPADDALFGAVAAGDLALDEELAALFLNVHERAPAAALYAPLGIGHHVDHQLCCSAADRLAQRKINVRFYEDFPYVTRLGALDARRAELGIAMEPEMVEISGTLPAKADAISEYRSQVPQLFGSDDRMRAAIGDYASAIRRTYPGIRIERVWRW